MIGKHPFQSLKLSIAAVCEYALESRGRWTLVGTFRELEFDRFPATVQRMEIFLLFTDVTDPDIRTAGVSLWPPSDGDAAFEEAESLMNGTCPLRRTNYPGAFEGALRFKDVVLPEPGRYDVYLEVNGEVFDLISLYVRSKHERA